MTGVKHEDIHHLVKIRLLEMTRGWDESLCSLPGCQDGLCPNPPAHAPSLRRQMRGRTCPRVLPLAWPPPVPTPSASH